MHQHQCHKKTILASALLLAFLPTSASATDYGDVLKSLQGSYYGSSGIETIVGLRDGQTATNTISATTPTNADKTFRIGSQSKMYTSSVLLKMMDSNAYGLSAADLDRSLVDIASAQSDADIKVKLNRLIATLPEGARAYTLREFMSMGTALPNYLAGTPPGEEKSIWNLSIDANYGPVDGYSGNNFDTHLRLVELAQQGFPGQPSPPFQHFYSNTNAVVLALMAEAISGQSFDALIQDYVTTPLGLNSAYLQTTPGNAQMVGTEAGQSVQNLDPTIPWTSGAMITNMGDLLTFLDAINHSGFLSPALTDARTANMNAIPMAGMPITYGLGLMNLEWNTLLDGLPAAIPDVVSTGHGGSIAGSSSFSGWLASQNFPTLNSLGLAVYANSLSTIDKGGYQSGTPSEALFVQAVEHLYRTARADGTMTSGQVTHGSTGGFITQTPYTGALRVANPAPGLIAYLDLRGNPSRDPVRITLDPSYSFYSADTSGSAETALTVNGSNTVDMDYNRIEGYGSAKTGTNTFTLLKLTTSANSTINGEIAAYGENAIALSHTGSSIGTLTLDPYSRLYSKGYGGMGLETAGTVIIESGSGDGALNPLEMNFGITAAILTEGSQSTGIVATGSANITLNPGASVGAVTYAGFMDEDGNIYSLDSNFDPVDEKYYAVRGASLSDSAQLIVDGGSIDATAAYFWNGSTSPGNGTLATGVELNGGGASLEVKNGGVVSASGYGVDFTGGSSNTLTLNDATVWGTLASLHASNNATVAVQADNSTLVGRVALWNVSSTSSFTMTDSTFDFSLQYPSSEALLQFGGSVNIDGSNSLYLPLSFGEIDMLDAGTVNEFAPVLHSSGDAFTVSVSPGYFVRYTGFTHNSPNSARLFPAFSAYASDKLQRGAFTSNEIVAMSLNPDRLTAESHATQTQVGLYLHSSVQGQVKRMIDATSDTQNPVSRLGQNTRSALASRLGRHNIAHLQGEMWQASALSAVNTPAPLHASGGTDFQTAYRFFGGYIHSERGQSSRKGYAGYDHDANGLLLGVTADPAPDFNLSFFAGTSSGETKYKRLASKIESDGLHLGAQGRYSRTLSDASTLRLGVRLDHTRLKNDSTRYTYTGADKTQDSYRQNLIGGGLDVTLEQRLGADVTLSPYAAFDAVHLKQDSIREHGPNALTVKGQNFTQKYATLGLGANRKIKIDNGPLVTFGANVGWRHAFDRSPQTVTANFQGYSDRFTSRSLDEGKNTLMGGLSLDLAWLKTSRPVVARLEYNYQRQEKASERQIYLGLEARF